MGSVLLSSCPCLACALLGSFVRMPTLAVVVVVMVIVIVIMILIALIAEVSLAGLVFARWLSSEQTDCLSVVVVLIVAVRLKSCERPRLAGAGPTRPRDSSSNCSYCTNEL